MPTDKDNPVTDSNDHGTRLRFGFRREAEAANGAARGQKPVRRLKGVSRRARSASSRVVARAAIGGNVRLRAYRYFSGPHRVQVTQMEMAVENLPDRLDGIRIVQLSDLHHGPWMPLTFVREIVDQANEFRPDIVALTGDYVANSSRYVQPGISVLKHLRARIGRFAVLGNHDWWEGVELVRNEFKKVNIPLIDNDRVFITPGGKIVKSTRRGLCIAGVGDQWEDSVDLEKALGGVPSDMPRILLSHNPDVAEDPELCEGKFRVDLMLSGHLHGGQVTLPVIGSPVLPTRHHKYARGLVDGPACPVFISRGLGTSAVPVRYGSPPEIVVLDLRVAKSGEVTA